MKNSEYKKLIMELKVNSAMKKYFLNSSLNQYRNKYVKKFISSKNLNSKILNVGDGTGTISLEFEALGFKKIIGLDSEKKYLDIARKRCKYTKFKVGNAHNLPFSDKSFDIITYIDVIEFLDFKKTISEASRVVKKGGFVYIENFNSIVLGFLSNFPILKHFIIKNNIYKLNNNIYFMNMLKKEGFKIIKSDILYISDFKDLKFKSKIYYLIITILGLKNILSPISFFYLRKIK